MDTQLALTMVVFVMMASLTALGGLALGQRQGRLKARLNELSGRQGTSLDRAHTHVVSRAVHTTLPKVGKHLMPTDADEQSRLKARLLHAGVYHPQAIPLFLGVKMLLIISPALLGFLAGLMGLIPVNVGFLLGGCASVLGMILPSLWLDRRKKTRQSALRRSLPDALDLIIVCMDGGLSLAAAMQRVTGELRAPHPILATELSILQRQVHFGQPMAEAIRSFAERTDLDDIRNLAATVKNAEKFGASMIKTLRTYGDSLRLKRQQHAEEMAALAGTKILFPTLLFIFPAIFLIILGPAAVQITQVLSSMK